MNLKKIKTAESLAALMCLMSLFISACSGGEDIGGGKVIEEAHPEIFRITVDGVSATMADDSTFYVRLPYGTVTKSIPVEFDANCEVLVEGIKSPEKIDLSNPLALTAANDEESREYSLIACFSDLPILYINTSAPVLNKIDWVKKSTMRVANAGEHDATYSTSIRGRGNSTWGYPKKPYAIKLDEKSEVLGMPKHKRWCLLANWMDRTNIRNDIAFKIGSIMSGLEWTPDGRFVDLVVNGEMMGTYYLCEQIKVDKNRVNIDELKPTDFDEALVTGGYLLEFDEYFDEEFKFMTGRLKLPVNLKSPDEDVPDVQLSYIRSYVDNVESSMAAHPAFSEIESLIDIDSYVDWWLLYELVGCDEPNHPKSAYMYKKRGGKLYAGPAWDFDWGTFKSPTRWLIKNSLWYRYLFSYKEFKSRIKERWAEHRDALGEVPQYIDGVAAEIRESAVFNSRIWPLDGLSDVNGDESLTFEESVERLKENYQKRYDWIDNNVSKL